MSGAFAEHNSGNVGREVRQHNLELFAVVACVDEDDAPIENDGRSAMGIYLMRWKPEDMFKGL